MEKGIELDLSPKEVEELKDFLHLGIQLGAGMQKNTGVLRKLLYGVLQRLPEHCSLTLGPETLGTEPAAYVYVKAFTYVKNEEKPQE